MREIEFRGLSVETNEWVYGDLIHGADRAFIVSDLLDAQLTPHKELIENPLKWAFETFEVIPLTIGQYTEFKDKSEVKIWEGDILKSNHDFTGGLVKFCCERSCSGYGWITNSMDVLIPPDCEGFKHEVIGSIHLNPELLGEDK